MPQEPTMMMSPRSSPPADRMPRRPRRRRRWHSKAPCLLCCVVAVVVTAVASLGGIGITVAAYEEVNEDDTHDNANKIDPSLSKREGAASSPAPAPVDFEDFLRLGDIDDEDSDSEDDGEDDDDDDDDESNPPESKRHRFQWHPPDKNLYQYDSLVMDPISMFGSPLGGFSRDVSSRLASLPLFVPSLSMEAPPDDPTYMQVRDANGQLFACRVYHQDELDPNRMNDGLFEPPRLVSGIISKADESSSAKGMDSTTALLDVGDAATDGRGGDGDGNADGESATAAAATTGRGVTMRDHRPDGEDEDDQGAIVGTVDATTSTTTTTTTTTVEVGIDGTTSTRTTTTSTTSGGTVTGDKDKSRQGGDRLEEESADFTKDDVEEKLGMLEGVCVHIHLGWWSTEWCYKTSVRQFHVHVDEKDASNLPHQVEITDITRLGQFERRRIEMLPPPVAATTTAESTDATNSQGNPNLPPNPLAGRQAEMARVLDVHSDGDVCDATGQPRSTLVQLLCCSNEVMEGARQFPVPPDSDPSAFPPVALYGVYEDPDKLCNYVVTVCTSLLCDDSSLTPVNKPTMNGNRKQGTGSGGNGGGARRARTSKAAPSEDGSIREILDFTLGERCLDASTDGWWSYSYCHGDRITQYHEVLEAKKSRPGVHVAERRVEAEHLLGVYQPEATESYPNHDEWRHVVNATDRGSNRGGGTGTYFEIEYTNGDVCDHSDVTDAAIIAGGAAGGASGGVIARAATVRFFCGKAYLLAVSEDSTCHYIVEVTVPALCQHPVFKEPIMKRQVVKCLPVDEDD